MISSEAGAQPNPAARVDDWLTPWRFAGLLALLIAACFPNVISGLESFYFRDYAVFGYPLAAYHKEMFWKGEPPLWNPYNNCGLPFLAQWNTLTLYPLSLFYLLLPMPWSLSLFCLGHLFLAGLGMYFLGYRWTGNRLAAAVAGIAFGYNGLTWHSLMWPNDIAALGWMPWVILTADRAWREGGRHIAVAALAGAMQMLSGAPEIILFTWFIAGTFWAAEWFTAKISVARLARRGLGVGMLVSGLAAAQLLPFIDLLAHSQRDSSYSDAQWAMPASGWANYLVPMFHTGPAGHGVFMQHGQYWTGSYYAGVGVVALALLAVWRVRSWRVWLLAGLTLFSLTMALGNNGYVYFLLRKLIPQLGVMRFPIKFVVVASFAFPLLAAHAVAWLRQLDEAGCARERARVVFIGLALVGIIAAILFFAWEKPQSGDDTERTILNGLRSAAFLAGILACCTVLQRNLECRKQILLQALLLVVLWMDVFTHVPALSPTVARSVFQSGAIREYFTAQHYLDRRDELQFGHSRFMATLDALRKLYFGRQEDPKTDVYGRRIALSDDLNLLDHIPKLDGFYSLYLHEMDTVLGGMYTATNDISPLKDFLGVSHENHSTNLMDLVERNTYAPLITAGQKPVFLDDRGALQLLFNTNFDGRKVVALPPGVRKVVQATNQIDARLSRLQFSANRISAEVSARQPVMVVIAQAYYHPWRAFVDGKSTPLWRANYAFQALQVPAGVHRVELIYHDVMFTVGAIISLITLVATLLLWFMTGKRP
jgi:hypothetical protein